MRLRYAGPGVSRDLEAHELDGYDVDELIRRGYYVPIPDDEAAPPTVAAPTPVEEAPAPAPAPDPVPTPQVNPFWQAARQPEPEPAHEEEAHEEEAN